MDRRRFLQWSWQLGAGTAALVAGTAGLGAAPAGTAGTPADLSDRTPWTPSRPRLFRPDSSGIAPGVQLKVQVGGVGPSGWSLQWQVAHAGQVHAHPAATAADAHWLPDGCAQLRCCVPYPFDDLIAGTYLISLALCDANGSLMEEAAVGSYALRRLRFSA